MFTTNLAIFIIMQLSRKSRTWEPRDQFRVKVRSSQVTSFSSSPKYEQVAFEIELIFYNGRFIDLDGNLQGQKGWQKLSAYLWHPRPQGLFPWLRTGGKRPYIKSSINLLRRLLKESCWNWKLACNVCPRKTKNTLLTLKLDPAELTKERWWRGKNCWTSKIYKKAAINYLSKFLAAL